MPSPKESQPSRKTRKEIASRLKSLIGDAASGEVIMRPGEDNITLKQEKIAPWRKNRHGLMIGTEYRISHSREELVFADDMLKEARTQVDAVCRTRIFGAPKIAIYKTFDAIQVNESPEALTQELMGILEKATMQDDTKPTSPKQETEQQKSSFYERFAVEKIRLFNASDGHLYLANENFQYTSFAVDNMVVRVSNNTNKPQELRVDIQIPHDDDKPNANITTSREYIFRPDAPVKSNIWKQGSQDTYETIKNVPDEEIETILAILQSAKADEIKQQLINRKLVEQKARELLVKYNGPIDPDERVRAEFPDNDPPVTIIQKYRGSIRIDVVPYIRTDGIEKDFSVTENYPIRVSKRNANGRGKSSNFEPAQPDEVIELLNTLDSIRNL